MSSRVTHERLLVDGVRQWLVDQGQVPSPASVAAALRAGGGVWGTAEILRILDLLRNELVGFGPLESWVRDFRVTDVLVNGPGEVYVDRGTGLEPVPARLPDEAAVRRLAQRLASAAGRRLDDAAPWVDARLAGGVRLHAVLPPIATNGTVISLRVPRTRAFTLEEMNEQGTVTQEMAHLLRRVVAARLAFLVTGGTGTGKTTLLTTLLGLVPPRQRLVIVEDTGELRPDHPHVVWLEARPPNVEGAGEVPLRSLVRQALRMRPDRLVVGEVRGAEVLDLLMALNTGHEGGCGTIHANSAAAAPARLEALGAMAGLSRAAVNSQVATAIDVIVGVQRASDGKRRVSELCLLHRRGDSAVAVPAWTTDGAGPALADLERRLAERHA